MKDGPLPHTPEQTGLTSEGHRIGEIELLRAIAILMVMIEHLPFNLIFWPARITAWLGGFWVGVDLFFAISGFVIARSLLPSLIDQRDPRRYLRITVAFWMRRAWRLLPASWLWLALPVPLCLWFNRSGAYGDLQANWELLIAGLLDLANFREAFVFGQFGSGTAFVQWSLSLEEQFYLLLPFAVLIFRRRLPIPLALLVLAGFLVPNTALAFQLRLWAVALGVLLAMWSRHPTYRELAPVALAHRRPARWAVLLIPLVAIVSVGTQSLHIVPFYQGPVTLLAGLLVWVASYDGNYLAAPSLFRRAMEWIAARSYALYLVHIPAYFAAHEIWFRLRGAADPTRRQALIYCLGGVALSFLLAELTYQMVETPLRLRGRGVAARFLTRESAA